MLRSRLLIAALLQLPAAYTFGATEAVKSDTEVALRHAGGVVYSAATVNGFEGGNVAASVGSDGILLVDSMTSAIMPKLIAALAQVSMKPVRLVINTHYHGDHVDGNATLTSTAIIVAQQETAWRLPGGYPVLQFQDKLTVRFNGENIDVIHLPAAHTGGDAIVYFHGSRVLHLGDLYFAGMFPSIHGQAGGDPRHLIVALEDVLSRYPADAVVVPGHGPVGSMASLKNYVAMLRETVAAAERALASGQSSAELARSRAFLKYKTLGDGGAQTVDEYAAMLLGLLR